MSGGWEGEAFKPGGEKSPPAGAMDDDADPGPCPVRPLGQSGGVYFYLSRAGEFRVMTFREHTANGISSLFDGDVFWLKDKFKSRDKKAFWDVSWSRDWLFHECRTAGFFDATRSMRGPGVWRDDDGGVVVHAGTQIWHAGNWQPAGCQIGDYVYPAGPKEPRMADTPAKPVIAKELFDFLGTWSWEKPDQAPHLLLGWLGAAALTGALRWRPHVWVTGDSGWGKSTLEQLIMCVLGEEAILRASDPSAPGVRQSLRGAARPVMLDELENDANNRRAKDVANLARLGSTDQQAAVLRGSSDQRASSAFIRACFYCTSIVRPHLDRQDMSRFALIDMKELEAKNAAVNVLAKLEHFKAAGPALRAAGYVALRLDRYEGTRGEECGGQRSRQT